MIPNNTQTRQCDSCGAAAVSRGHIHHSTKIKHDGRVHDIEVPDLEVDLCAACGEVEFDEKSVAQMYDALRQKLGLYRPSEIRRLREGLGKTQAEMGKLLHVAPESISRWETGALLQSEGSNERLREFFEVPALRRFLEQGPVHYVLATNISAQPCDVNAFQVIHQELDLPQTEYAANSNYAIAA